MRFRVISQVCSTVTLRIDALSEAEALETLIRDYPERIPVTARTLARIPKKSNANWWKRRILQGLVPTELAMRCIVNQIANPLDPDTPKRTPKNSSGRHEIPYRFPLTIVRIDDQSSTRNMIA